MENLMEKESKMLHNLPPTLLLHQVHLLMIPIIRTMIMVLSPGVTTHLGQKVGIKKIGKMDMMIPTGRVLIKVMTDGHELEQSFMLILQTKVLK